MQQLKMNASDARETYEMLRASHTLLRMAFGACAMIEQPKDKEAAKRFQKSFTDVFSTIAKAAQNYLSLAEQGESTEDSKPNN